jgi:hypothetical protein
VDYTADGAVLVSEMFCLFENKVKAIFKVQRHKCLLPQETPEINLRSCGKYVTALLEEILENAKLKIKLKPNFHNSSAGRIESSNVGSGPQAADF